MHFVRNRLLFVFPDSVSADSLAQTPAAFALMPAQLFEIFDFLHSMNI